MPDTLDSLRQQLAALPAVDTLASLREREEDAKTRSFLAGRISTVETNSRVVAERTPQLDAVTANLAVLQDVREKLCNLLDTCNRPSTNIERGRLQNTKMSIVCCDRGISVAEGSGWELPTLELGKLLKEAGAAWVASIPELQRRITELQREVTDAQGRMDFALASDEERAALDEAAVARAKAFDALPKSERTRIVHERHREYMASR
jgi:hypothetical protein